MDEKYEIAPTKSFGELAKDFKPQEKLTARNSWEDLINQIALQTNEKDKMKLASLLAIKGHMLKLSTTVKWPPSVGQQIKNHKCISVI